MQILTLTQDINKIGTIREDRLFEDNGINFVVRNLPDYPVYDEQKYFWNLYTNDYFSWNQDCDFYNGLTRDYILEQADRSVGIQSSLGVTLALCIIFFILSCIFVCISACYKEERDLERLKYKKIFEIVSV